MAVSPVTDGPVRTAGFKRTQLQQQAVERAKLQAWRQALDAKIAGNCIVAHVVNMMAKLVSV
jgi:Na+/melibiose symporter-like transporter